MATTRISKIKVRNGDLSDLPVLDPSEFGYSTDEHRLFIGNDELTVGTGDGSRKTFNIPISSNFPLPTNNLENPKFFVNGSQRSDITIGGTTVTFTTAPVINAIITIKLVIIVIIIYYYYYFFLIFLKIVVIIYLIIILVIIIIIITTSITIIIVVILLWLL